MSNVNKKVKFSDNITIKYIDYSNLQCIRQFYDDYDICKKQFIENKYIEMYGSLVNFNYNIELEKHIKNELEYEKILLQELELNKNICNVNNNKNHLIHSNNLYNKFIIDNYDIYSDSDSHSDSESLYLSDSDTDSLEYIYDEKLNLNNDLYDKLDIGFDFSTKKK